MLADVVRRAAGAGIVLPEIGEAFAGGFFAGIIDTTRPGSIIAADQYQSGLRYALVISPGSLESSSTMQWRTSSTTVAQAQTRWNGLAAQQALASTTFPAFNYCAGLSHPADGGSPWYLPALDELELLYRNFKPDTTSNAMGNRPQGTFPPTTAGHGENISSDPVGAPYTAGSPARTLLSAFQAGGAHAFKQVTSWYWAATWYSPTGAWLQRPSDGNQTSASQGSNDWVRPVRRVLL